MNRSTIHVGSSIGGLFSGRLSAAFTPEDGSICLYATPGDKRRSSIWIHLTDIAPLKELVSNLESVIEEEAKKRARPAPPPLVQEGEDIVSVVVGGTSVSLPRTLYDEAASYVAFGRTVLAAGALSKALPWLGVTGAKALADAICAHQRTGGIRE